MDENTVEPRIDREESIENSILDSNLNNCERAKRRTVWYNNKSSEYPQSLNHEILDTMTKSEPENEFEPEVVDLSRKESSLSSPSPNISIETEANELALSIQPLIDVKPVAPVRPARRVKKTSRKYISDISESNSLSGICAVSKNDEQLSSLTPYKHRSLPVHHFHDTNYDSLASELPRTNTYKNGGWKTLPYSHSYSRNKYISEEDKSEGCKKAIECDKRASAEQRKKVGPYGRLERGSRYIAVS